MRNRFLSLLLLAAAGCTRAPAAPARPLVATGDTLIAPYGEVTEAAWLDGARWAVIAPQDRAVGVADFATHRFGPFTARAAAELPQPFHLFRSGDSLYIADWLRRRVTAWSLGGALGGATTARDELRGALPRDRDAAGRWYFELRPAPGRDGSGNRDSGRVVRSTADPARYDTLMSLAPFDLAQVVTEGRSRLERRLLSGQDRWGATPDGAVWVARVDNNSVGWRRPDGRILRGPDLPDRVLPITENDRELFLNRFDPGLRPSVSAIPFAAIKPAFEDALTGPDGRVWLVGSRAVGDTLRRYQVVDGDGRLALTTSHPGLGRILALGAGGQALVAEPFEAGVRLLLFRLPPDSQVAAR